LGGQNNAISTTVLLRSLDVNNRNTGMGIQNVVFRLLGTIPGPLVFGVRISLGSYGCVTFSESVLCFAQ